MQSDSINHTPSFIASTSSLKRSNDINDEDDASIGLSKKIRKRIADESLNIFQEPPTTSQKQIPATVIKNYIQVFDGIYKAAQEGDEEITDVLARVRQQYLDKKVNPAVFYMKGIDLLNDIYGSRKKKVEKEQSSPIPQDTFRENIEKLTSLTFGENATVEVNSEQEVISLIESVPHLKTIEFINCKYVTDHVLCALALHSQELTSFTLKDPHSSISNLGLMLLTSGCPLEHLSISSDMELGWESVNALVNNPLELKSLKLYCHLAFSCEDLLDLLEGYNLQEVVLENIQSTQNAINLNKIEEASADVPLDSTDSPWNRSPTLKFPKQENKDPEFIKELQSLQSRFKLMVSAGEYSSEEDDESSGEDEESSGDEFLENRYLMVSSLTLKNCSQLTSSDLIRLIKLGLNLELFEVSQMPEALTEETIKVISEWLLNDCIFKVDGKVIELPPELEDSSCEVPSGSIRDND